MDRKASSEALRGLQRDHSLGKDDVLSAARQEIIAFVAEALASPTFTDVLFFQMETYLGAGSRKVTFARHSADYSIAGHHCEPAYLVGSIGSLFDELVENGAESVAIEDSTGGHSWCGLYLTADKARLLGRLDGHRRLTEDEFASSIALALRPYGYLHVHPLESQSDPFAEIQWRIINFVQQARLGLTKECFFVQHVGQSPLEVLYLDHGSYPQRSRIDEGTLPGGLKFLYNSCVSAGLSPSASVSDEDPDTFYIMIFASKVGSPATRARVTVQAQS